ncbi:MAG: arginine--tRNA ligase [Bacilli bacterium]|nr:arginine--tRNA ligase [Bacilli bacterium]
MFRSSVSAMLAKEVSLSLEQIEGLLETPANEEFGDVAFPCFQLAKTLRKAPPVIAVELANSLQTKLTVDGAVERVVPAAGYINFFFRRDVLTETTLNEILAKGDQYAASQEGNGQTVAVDYSSPNIAKPFAISHLRSTMIGNAIANIYETLGYDVIRINHIGDWGTSFGKLIVAYRMWGSEYNLQEDAIKQLLEMYVRVNAAAEADPSLEDQARAASKALEDGDPDTVQIWQKFIDISLAEFKKIYNLLDVSFTTFKGESFYIDQTDAVVDALRARNLLTRSEGADVVMLDDENMPPCLILRSDGATIYPTRDLAAALYRHDVMKADRLLYVVGAEQKLHFDQVFAVLRKMGHDWAERCVHVPFGILRFEGKKLSSRKGQVVFLEDVLQRAIETAAEIIDQKNPEMENRVEVAQAVGVGAIVFNDLKNNRLHDVTFTWEEALNFEGETGPYVQYTYARASSLLRKAGLQQTEGQRIKLSGGTLTGDVEWSLVKLLGRLPNALDRAKENYDPSVVAKHVIDVCQQFNRYYNSTRIVDGTPEEMQQKLALVAAARIVIRRCLTLLGLRALESI